jgi:putative ABC transport system permease protein
MLLNILSQTFATLAANKLRSFLTMFGIAWGILSLILMTSSGEGFRIAQRESLRNLGKDIMIVWSGRTSIQSGHFQKGRHIQLEYSDYSYIREHSRLIALISPEVSRYDLVSKTHLNNGTFGMHGVLPEYQYMRTIETRWGRLLNPADNDNARAVCVIGSEVNEQLFNDPEADSTGQTISIAGHPFTVIGVMPYKEQNNSYSGQDRRMIFIPYPTMVRLFSNPSLGQSRDFLNNLIAMPVDPSLHEEAEREVRTLLAKKKNFDPADQEAIFIWNTARQAKLIDSMLKSMQWFLGTVGVITLALGCIGVINIMLITIRERTVEIGLRKSVGARRRDVLWQFFTESFTLTLLSGLLGILGGWTICFAVNQLPLPKQIFAGMIFTGELAIMAFGVLTTAGIAAGLYPAYMAAEMDPIEALRYEAN